MRGADATVLLDRFVALVLKHFNGGGQLPWAVHVLAIHLAS